VGNPNEMSVLAFAEHINAATANPGGVVFHELPPSRAGDPARRCPDIARARELLGWAPKVQLKAGLQKTIPYFKQQLGIS